MANVSDVIELLRHSPKLPDIVAELKGVLDIESRRRQRFYEEMTEDMKIEFIDGEVVLHSPARNVHLIVTDLLNKLLSAWVDDRKLGQVKSEKCLCVFPRNDYEPDIVFFTAERAAKFGPEMLKFPVPDFAVEVLSESTEENDRGVKFDDYDAHGVREYWMIDCAAETVEQYVLRNKRFELALKSASGEVASEVITGFRIPIRAIFDMDANCAALRAMIRQ
ncbi:MAG TPA: Uma2 family endonuclease [Planctomycetota bacterium]|nr:Uma2 family endonuclease [Planctomycetota bacterium]